MPEKLGYRLVLLLALAGGGPVAGLGAVLVILGSASPWTVGLLTLAGAAGVAAAGAIARRRVNAALRRIDVMGAGTHGGTPGPWPVGAILRAAQRLNDRHVAREEELLASLRGVEGMVQALPDPVLAINPRRQVVGANPAAAQLLGPHVEGRDLALSLRDPDILAAVETVIAGETARDVEFTIPAPVETTFQVSIRRVESGERARYAALVALHDITSVKRSEQLRGDFVANASHELRTPLSSLLGFIETLRGPAREDQEATQRFLGLMQQQAERMNRLVHDLLSLSRIELDEHTPPRGAVNLLDVLRSVLAGLEHQAKAQGMALRLSLAETARVPVVRGERDQLEQVFQNIIENALKYGCRDTPVEIRIEAAEPSSTARQSPYRVAVRDHGEGIAREHIPRLTERFYRVEPARSRALGGTGLGLAITKHIVNRHRGRLTIDSEPGKGSTFTVTLPRAETEAEGEAGAERAGDGAATAELGPAADVDGQRSAAKASPRRASSRHGGGRRVTEVS